MARGIKDLIVVGAGPSGLATAIAAKRAGLDYEVLEKGVLVNSIFNFPRQMTFFTTPELLEIGGLPFVTPYEKPTQFEALRYYRRVAESYGLELALGCEVTSLRREADGPFTVATRDASGPGSRRARAVAVATGYYDLPNRLGIPGEDLPHVSHYWSEAHAYYRRPVVVVGGKNSAAIAALELYRAGASVTLVHRGEALSGSIKYWIKPDIDNRIKEGSVRALFGSVLERIEPEGVRVRTPDGVFDLPAQAVFLLTGYRPDVGLLEAAGVTVDPKTLKPAHDPATLETDVAGLYVVGAVGSGHETSRIFIENGRFHGDAIVRAVCARMGRPAPPPLVEPSPNPPRSAE
jgi:thioredoxin reductase (NADPH)